MQVINYVGIDVSAKTLVLKAELNGTLVEGVREFDNTRVGHKKLIKFITKKGRCARVCMEATGTYHFELALQLSQHKKTEVMVVNPKFIKFHAGSSGQRAKTDACDAAIILDYLKEKSFRSWKAPTDNLLEIRLISRRMFQLKASLVQDKNRLHAVEFCESKSQIAHRDIEVSINHFRKRIDHLKSKALAIMIKDPLLKKTLDILLSIKGVGEISAIQIIAEIGILPEDMSPKQWVAYAGLDPCVAESGTSLHKVRYISKKGNKYLRTALYMPALVAAKHDPAVRAFYEKLVNAGKKPMQAVVAVMRKLLHAMWGMLKSDTLWDNTKFYKLPLEKA